MAPARRVAGVAAIALAAALVAGCTGSSGSGTAGPTGTDGTPGTEGTAGTAGTAEEGSGPDAADEHGGHDDHVDSGRTAVGPLALPVAEYWSVLQPSDGLTAVMAGGCPQDTPCPGFEIRTGVALDDVDPAAAFVPDDATCPGTDALRATVVGDGAPAEAEVAGTDATLTRWTLSCVDDAGEEVRTVEQLQWYVADAPEGPVLVVDRWAFEGLGSRLAAGEWSVA
ncbi:hypothetical protein IF650_08245 [Cellulosimicrobium terreum]|nr:hypothetical protein [Cellulosimicrobium terreum]